jgi:hypothetical protein
VEPTVGLLHERRSGTGIELAVKKLMITAAIALSATTAGAEVFIPSGAWGTFQTVTNDEKKPVCGMQTTFPKDNASIMIKYILGEKGLLVQMFKDS